MGDNVHEMLKSYIHLDLSSDQIKRKLELHSMHRDLQYD